MKQSTALLLSVDCWSKHHYRFPLLLDNEGELQVFYREQRQGRIFFASLLEALLILHHYLPRTLLLTTRISLDTTALDGWSAPELNGDIPRLIRTLYPHNRLKPKPYDDLFTALQQRYDRVTESAEQVSLPGGSLSREQYRQMRERLLTKQRSYEIPQSPIAEKREEISIGLQPRIDRHGFYIDAFAPVNLTLNLPAEAGMVEQFFCPHRAESALVLVLQSPTEGVMECPVDPEEFALFVSTVLESLLRLARRHTSLNGLWLDRRLSYYHRATGGMLLLNDEDRANATATAGIEHRLQQLNHSTDPLTALAVLRDNPLYTR